MRVLSCILFAYGICNAIIIPSALQITYIDSGPYIAGDTVKFCTMLIAGPQRSQPDSVFISTNLFSRPLRPIPVIFFNSAAVPIDSLDISWKFLGMLNSDNEADTISFVAYYVPFDSDSLFFIDFRIGKVVLAKKMFKMSSDKTASASGSETYTIFRQPGLQVLPNYFDMLGRQTIKNGNECIISIIGTGNKSTCAIPIFNK